MSGQPNVPPNTPIDMQPNIRIDASALPETCLVDTGVLIRALWQRNDDETPACHAFFDAMLSAVGRLMLVAAPTVAEMLRGNPQPLPRTRSLLVVPFDLRAAELLGAEMPVEVLRAHRAHDEVPLSYLKYDAMIVACARRWEADCIIALDTDHVMLARHVGLPVLHPREFALDQT